MVVKTDLKVAKIEENYLMFANISDFLAFKPGSRARAGPPLPPYVVSTSERKEHS